MFTVSKIRITLWYNYRKMIDIMQSRHISISDYVWHIECATVNTQDYLPTQNIYMHVWIAIGNVCMHYNNVCTFVHTYAITVMSAVIILS